MNASRDRGLRLLTLGALLWLLTLLGGCVSAPSKNAGKSEVDGIHIVENQSVDLSVRQDFDAATRMLQEQRYAEGIELLKKVIKGSHNNSAPYINISLAYVGVGDLVLAEQNLKKALEINPGHPVAMNEYAMLQRKSGRYIEARAQYEQLLSRYPEFMPARKNLGILCDLYLKDAACALQQYELYSAANPDDEEVRLWLASLKQGA